jgi:1,4-alpha-glucan branching enzyme
MKYYKIDGFRIDNVDGIIRYGDNGEGDERPYGRVFLKELNSQIYTYNPTALIHYEAHYYYEDNAKMLVAPINSGPRALGATAYNSSRLTYFFHTQYMPKSVEEVSLWKFKHITDEMEWGGSNSTVADFHNHDAAAGLMEGRATGSYAYDAMMVKNPANHPHAVGKIKIMEAFISCFREGRTLDLLQTFLLQSGTFEHDSSVQWYLSFNQANKNLLNFKKELNLLMDNPAFWPCNVDKRKYLNVDDESKILVVERKSESERFIIILNFSAWKHHNYKIGLTTNNDYEVIFNSDMFEYSGMGIVSYPSILKNQPSSNFELLTREVELSVVAPYGVVVLKEKHN